VKVSFSGLVPSHKFLNVHLVSPYSQLLGLLGRALGRLAECRRALARASHITTRPRARSKRAPPTLRNRCKAGT